MRRRILAFSLPLILGFPCVDVTLCAQGVAPRLAEALAVHRGHKVVVDVPDYAGFDVELPIPSDWRIVRATPETYERLLAFLGSRVAPAVGFIDPHGNLIHVEGSPKCRTPKRFLAALRTYESMVARLVKRLDTLLSDAARAHAKRNGQREVDLLLEVRDLGVIGYGQVERAEKRLAAIERDRHARLYRILAREGSDRPRKLLGELESLQRESNGLDTAVWIRRHITILRQGLTVRSQSS